MSGSETYNLPPVIPAARLRPGGPEDDHRTPRHVLTAVVAALLNDGRGSAVANDEPLSTGPVMNNRPPVAPYNTALPAPYRTHLVL